MLLREIRRRAHRFLGPSISICLVTYFAYHLVEGRRGFFAWQHYETQLSNAQERVGELKVVENSIANRVSLLNPKSVCVDLLVERAKEILGYAHPDEMVISTQK